MSDAEYCMINNNAHVSMEQDAGGQIVFHNSPAPQLPLQQSAGAAGVEHAAYAAHLQARNDVRDGLEVNRAATIANEALRGIGIPPATAQQLKSLRSGFDALAYAKAARVVCECNAEYVDSLKDYGQLGTIIPNIQAQHCPSTLALW